MPLASFYTYSNAGPSTFQKQEESGSRSFMDVQSWVAWLTVISKYAALGFLGILPAYFNTSLLEQICKLVQPPSITETEAYSPGISHTAGEGSQMTTRRGTNGDWSKWNLAPWGNQRDGSMPPSEIRWYSFQGHSLLFFPQNQYINDFKIIKSGMVA